MTCFERKYGKKPSELKQYFELYDIAVADPENPSIEAKRKLAELSGMLYIDDPNKEKITQAFGFGEEIIGELIERGIKEGLQNIVLSRHEAAVFLGLYLARYDKIDGHRDFATIAAFLGMDTPQLVELQSKIAEAIKRGDPGNVVNMVDLANDVMGPTDFYELCLYCYRSFVIEGTTVYVSALEKAHDQIFK